jgi:hypothetical protein
MSRLFITPRELDFFSDIAKEVIKDVGGQVIYYYPISELKTKTHGVYNESLEKVFDNPIILDALVDSHFQSDTKIDSFGVDKKFKLEVFVQYRDLVEKGINVQIGDFFSFSDIFYEITENVILRNIGGLPEHKDGVKLIGTKAREGQFKTAILGPTDISHTDGSAVQGKVVSHYLTLSAENESLGKRIRGAKLEKIPYALVIGDKEIESESVGVESRDEGQLGPMKLNNFINKLKVEILNKNGSK